LCGSNKWDKVTVIVRRELEGWAQLAGSSFKNTILLIFSKIGKEKL
jgi:hypothetical protein